MVLSAIPRIRKRARHQRRRTWRRLVSAVEGGDTATVLVVAESYQRLLRRQASRGQVFLPDARVRLEPFLPRHRTSVTSVRMTDGREQAVTAVITTADFLRSLVQQQVLSANDALALGRFDVRSPRSLLNVFEVVPAIGLTVSIPRIAANVARKFPAAARAS